MCPNLNNLHLYGRRSVNTLVTLSQHHLPKEGLVLSYPVEIPDEELPNCAYALSRIRVIRTNTPCFYRLQSKLPYLTGLYRLFLDKDNDNQLLHMILPICQNLIYLSINSSCRFTFTEFLTLILACPNLRTLRISDAFRMTDEDLTMLVMLCPHLQVFDVDYITDTGLLALSEHCRNIHELIIGLSLIHI